MISSALAPNAFFLSFSKPSKNKCPPSRIGKGKRLKIARLTLNTAIKWITAIKPNFAALEVIKNIPKGPVIESRMDIFPVTNLAKPV